MPHASRARGAAGLTLTLADPSPYFTEGYTGGVGLPAHPMKDFLLLIAVVLLICGWTASAIALASLVVLAVVVSWWSRRNIANNLLVVGNFLESFQTCANAAIDGGLALGGQFRWRWSVCAPVFKHVWAKIRVRPPAGMSHDKFMFLAFAGWEMSVLPPENMRAMYYDRERLIEAVEAAGVEEMGAMFRALKDDEPAA